PAPGLSTPGRAGVQRLESGHVPAAASPAHHPSSRGPGNRRLPPGMAGPGVQQRRAPALPPAAQPRPGLGDHRRRAGTGHRAAGARIRRRPAPLRARPAQGQDGCRRERAGSRQPRAQGRSGHGRAPADPASQDQHRTHLHGTFHPPGPGRGPVSRASARRRAGTAGGHPLAPGPPGRTGPARGLLRRPLAGRPFHRPGSPGGTRVTELREACIALARAAGAAILDVYARDFSVEAKDDDSPLTQADLASHRIICEGLRRLDPAIPVLSEEAAGIAWEERRTWSRYWLVDPLDGTREFVKKNGEFTVNIALVEGHRPVLGVVYAPVFDYL